MEKKLNTTLWCGSLVMLSYEDNISNTYKYV